MAYMTRDETITAIRTALKRRSGKQWTVRGGRGTAYGWITISSPPARLGCERPHNRDYRTETCTVCGEYIRYSSGDAVDYCRAHECSERCYGRMMTPEDRIELAALLGLRTVHPQGVSIAASSDYYTEYVARAAGIEQRGEQIAASKLTEADVHAIHVEAALGLSNLRIGERHNISPEVICRILKGEAWAHVVAMWGCSDCGLSTAVMGSFRCLPCRRRRRRVYGLAPVREEER